MSSDPSPFSSSGVLIYLACQNSTGNKATNTMYSLLSIFLLLPLYILILRRGFQRWRRCLKLSHTDFMIVLRSVLNTFSLYINSFITFMLGLYLFSITLLTQTLFHVLTSLERHLAVVHAVTYMRLRESFGLRVRNFSTGRVWLLGFGWAGVTAWYSPTFPTTPFFSFLGLCVSAMMFYCLSVLRTLTESKPGKRQTDQSKQKAFHMIVIITGALLLRVGSLSLCLGLTELVPMERGDLCAAMDSGMWLTVPSSLVLPLLFLHSARTLICSRIKPAE
ncbi:uncharacterized protein LOC114156859 [Xiphophorus couchianus]|uniref:uncharacterized protein LOC114156859 n=1 Tax=Xiphophorus couchianus TaxID=32473 RepID=UPI0010160925|nr:uncharacterized protein LOC114156859 [Xiphophorus couchianus]